MRAYSAAWQMVHPSTEPPINYFFWLHRVYLRCPYQKSFRAPIDSALDNYATVFVMKPTKDRPCDDLAEPLDGAR
jgi:hypothetical protein